jgi:hypothetical protein
MKVCLGWQTKSVEMVKADIAAEDAELLLWIICG